ncbi:hypothetical protein SO694_00037264 [Aureococcus anophagefferens]|uniref:Uncharacterized protein n=1 Tax=Aureococcus anophagefferens TaxID=44056 RepID=A0ABR1FL46_AURAN
MAAAGPQAAPEALAVYAASPAPRKRHSPPKKRSAAEKRRAAEAAAVERTRKLLATWSADIAAERAYVPDEEFIDSVLQPGGPLSPSSAGGGLDWTAFVAGGDSPRATVGERMASYEEPGGDGEAKPSSAAAALFSASLNPARRRRARCPSSRARRRGVVAGPPSRVARAANSRRIPRLATEFWRARPSLAPESVDFGLSAGAFELTGDANRARYRASPSGDRAARGTPGRRRRSRTTPPSTPPRARARAHAAHKLDGVALHPRLRPRRTIGASGSRRSAGRRAKIASRRFAAGRSPRRSASLAAQGREAPRARAARRAARGRGRGRRRVPPRVPPEAVAAPPRARDRVLDEAQTLLGSKWRAKLGAKQFRAMKARLQATTMGYHLRRDVAVSKIAKNWRCYAAVHLPRAAHAIQMFCRSTFMLKILWRRRRNAVFLEAFARRPRQEPALGALPLRGGAGSGSASRPRRSTRGARSGRR